MEKKVFKDVVLNNYGYYELINPPTLEERKKVFEAEYYQNATGSYESTYTKEELKWFENKMKQKELMLRAHLPGEKEHFSLLDIGCGEGFALAHFKRSGFEVTGIDFSTYGILSHNPEVADYMIAGDCEEIIPTFIGGGQKFDIINIDSVLEMMIHPKTIISMCKEILTDDGILLIKTANNYSPWQVHLLEEGKLSDTYWLDIEGKPSYFNREGLINLMDDYGYECIDTFGDSFIDFNLANKDTNYYEMQGVGKNCYWAQVDLENFMHEISPEKTLEVFRILGEMGLGRKVICLFRIKKEKE